jgi:hypothetical protein
MNRFSCSLSLCSTEPEQYVHFTLQKFFRNKNISKKLKLRLKNIIIDKTLIHAPETWIPTQRDRKQTFLKGKCIEEF